MFDVFFDSVESPDNGNDDEGCIDVPSGINHDAMNSQYKGMYNTCIMYEHVLCCFEIAMMTRVILTSYREDVPV